MRLRRKKVWKVENMTLMDTFIRRPAITATYNKPSLWRRLLQLLRR